TYAWSDGSVNRHLTVQSSVADTITVSVTVTNSNGDTGHDSLNVMFDICDYISTTHKEIIQVYPVPSENEITISELPQNYYLDVVDMTGRMIIDHEFVAAHHKMNIHLAP